MSFQLMSCRHRPALLAFAASVAAPLCVHAESVEAASSAPIKSLGVVVITGSGQPTSLPTQIPTTLESITRDDIERKLNARDSEDTLKYFPSLLVRKRYIGDYNHAVLSSRASGTGNSARSAVYADGILLSNYLGNGVGGLSFPPRWGMVTPAEIDRVDVMYGPFSAAYPGNSVGAVVAYTTHMPTAFEAQARVGYSHQPFQLYSTNTTYRAWETSAGVGNKAGNGAWRLDLSHSDSQGQPLTFATRLLSAGTATAPPGSSPKSVTGAVLDANNTGQPWYVLGTGTAYRTQQDHVKLKLAYDLTPTLRANYLLGVWHNTAVGEAASYLRDAAGAPVENGPVRINGQVYAGTQALGAADFALTREALTHVMQAFSLNSHTRGVWDWAAQFSRYNYRQDEKRQNATPLPAARSGGAGTLANGSGSGWRNLAVNGTWRPPGVDGAHVVDLGFQQDDYRLRYPTFQLPGQWQEEAASAPASSDVQGRTRLRSVYAQDAWALAPQWKTVLGLRAEQWQAFDAVTRIASANLPPYAARSERYVSPKAALSFEPGRHWLLKASLGRAVRMPTVSELYGATSSANAQFINDPNLRPERSWTAELSGEQELSNGLFRLTAFMENTRDALYSQTTFDPAANKNISRVQNVGRIGTQGVEAVYNGDDVGGVRELAFNGSVTYAQSLIKDNAGFVTTPGDTLGKWQPNIPRWRAAALASYRIDPAWTASLGARYSGTQFRTLNNADINGRTYQGVSPYLTVDLRVHWKIDKQWRAAFGIDNLNNARFWNFHPYPQRTYSAELAFSL